MRNVLLLLVIFVLSACTQTLDLQLASEVTVYRSDDRANPLTLTAKDSEYALFNHWLNEHRSEWHPTKGRFRGGIFMKSGKDGIQVTKSEVILYASRDGKMEATHAAQIGPNELQPIKDIGKKSK